jgi:hypothetical protein
MDVSNFKIMLDRLETDLGLVTTLGNIRVLDLCTSDDFKFRPYDLRLCTPWSTWCSMV